MNTWTRCKNILCIRPDNMGDLLMSAPAMAALKESFNCKITVLTSPMAQHIAAHIPCIDDTIVWQVPWVKGGGTVSLEAFENTVRLIRNGNFDAAVIFTVFSQNPLPSALLATMAGIPYRLAYCRENPYELLTHWVEEKEPYSLLRHQVRRDLDLVQSVGARTRDDSIRLRLPSGTESQLWKKLRDVGIDPTKPWLIIHPGVSEAKRQYDIRLWIETGRQLTRELAHQIIITGVEKESALAAEIRDSVGHGAFSVAGLLTLDELITLVRYCPMLISVNTGVAHLAAALQTKVIVLYALTNPQHPPWKAIGKILPFSVKKGLESRNEVLRFVQKQYYEEQNFFAMPKDIVHATHQLLINKEEPFVEELVLPSHPHLQGIRNTLNFQEP